MGAFVAIDMKSFYASVECVWRDLDPLKANLLVADESRSDKTICWLFPLPSKRKAFRAAPASSRRSRPLRPGSGSTAGSFPTWSRFPGCRNTNGFPRRSTP